MRTQILIVLFLSIINEVIIPQSKIKIMLLLIIFID